ncbi:MULTISPECIES: DUF6233 domain-containing protein [unclassified Streptomyces]|uniref:DUF6233 domain-containing protein n=1 Tax=unclassified Streptomyces TaxID=2593676 RepID=UPI00343C71C1
MTVTLPGGRTVDARLRARRRDTDGWWYQLPGFNRLGAPRADGALLLHRADCWVAEGRLTPANATEAAAFVWHGWATGCDVCEPVP